jgi:hypothetical protein
VNENKNKNARFCIISRAFIGCNQYLVKVIADFTSQDPSDPIPIRSVPSVPVFTCSVPASDPALTLDITEL